MRNADFDVNLRLGLAVIMLASLYWESGVQKDVLNSPSKLSPYIDRLMDLAVAKTSLDMIRVHYEYIGGMKAFNMEEGEKLHRLRRRIVRSSDALPNLPEFLYVSDALQRKIGK